MPRECPQCHDNGLPCFVCRGNGQLPTREEEEEVMAAEEREWERQLESALEDLDD